jgi:hypothetical protein
LADCPGGERCEAVAPPRGGPASPPGGRRVGRGFAEPATQGSRSRSGGRARSSMRSKSPHGSPGSTR